MWGIIEDVGSWPLVLVIEVRTQSVEFEVSKIPRSHLEMEYMIDDVSRSVVRRGDVR